MHVTEQECEWLLETVSLLRGLYLVEAACDGPDRALAPVLLHHTLRYKLNYKADSHNKHVPPQALSRTTRALIAAYTPAHMEAYRRRNGREGRSSPAAAHEDAEKAAAAAVAAHTAAHDAGTGIHPALVSHTVYACAVNPQYDDPCFHNCSVDDSIRSAATVMRVRCSPTCLFARILRYHLLTCPAVREMLSYSDEATLLMLFADPRTKQLDWLAQQDRVRAYARIIPFLVQWCARGAVPVRYGNARHAMVLAHDVRLACYNPVDPLVDTGLPDAGTHAHASCSHAQDQAHARFPDKWTGEAYTRPKQDGGDGVLSVLDALNRANAQTLPSPGDAGDKKAVRATMSAPQAAGVRACRFLYMTTVKHSAYSASISFSKLLPVMSYLEARSHEAVLAQRKQRHSQTYVSSTRSRSKPDPARVAKCSWSMSPLVESAMAAGLGSDEDQIVGLYTNAYDGDSATARKKKDLAGPVANAVTALVSAAVASELQVCPRALQLHLQHFQQLQHHDQDVCRRYMAAVASPALKFAVELYTYLVLVPLGPDDLEASETTAAWHATDDLLDRGSAAPALDVLRWWRENAADFPTLAPIARHALSALVILPPNAVDNPTELFARIRDGHVRAPAPAAESLHTVGNIRLHAYMGHQAREAPAAPIPHALDAEAHDPALREMMALAMVNSALVRESLGETPTEVSQ
jgi:hypothetical protein